MRIKNELHLKQVLTAIGQKIKGEAINEHQISPGRTNKSINDQILMPGS